jgi:hypothetical protein
MVPYLWVYDPADLALAAVGKRLDRVAILREMLLDSIADPRRCGNVVVRRRTQHRRQNLHAQGWPSQRRRTDTRGHEQPGAHTAGQTIRAFCAHRFVAPPINNQRGKLPIRYLLYEQMSS